MWAGVPQPHPPGGRIDGNWFSTISQMSTQCDDDDGENSNDDDGDGDNDKTKLSTTPVWLIEVVVYFSVQLHIGALSKFCTQKCSQQKNYLQGFPKTARYLLFRHHIWRKTFDASMAAIVANWHVIKQNIKLMIIPLQVNKIFVSIKIRQLLCNFARFLLYVLRLEICQIIYTTGFLTKILHTESA